LTMREKYQVQNCVALSSEKFVECSTLPTAERCYRTYNGGSESADRHKRNRPWILQIRRRRFDPASGLHANPKSNRNPPLGVITHVDSAAQLNINRWLRIPQPSRQSTRPKLDKITATQGSVEVGVDGQSAGIGGQRSRLPGSEIAGRSRRFSSFALALSEAADQSGPPTGTAPRVSR
jgi:hypothetical protein